jgi:hypothetical protein
MAVRSFVRELRWLPNLAAIAALLLPAVTCQGQVTLTEVTRFNLFNVLSPTTGPDQVTNPNFIGNNAGSVAWSDSRLFVCGFNNTGGNSTTGIIEVLNTTATGIVANNAVQYGPRFGSLAAPDQRGYSGLAFDTGRLFAAFDNGSVQGNALVGYDLEDELNPSRLWGATGRGGAGVSLDPGYIDAGQSQGGSGVAWATFGDGVTGSSNRRALNDPVTGASIYGFASQGSPVVPPGFVWNAGGFPRDLTFDPATGDLYGRTNNDVIKAARTGPNSAATPQSIWSSNSGSSSGQNIAFMSDTVSGDLLVFNSRPDGGAQSLTNAVQIADTSGAVQTATWSFLGGTSPTGRGYYDFSFDPAAQTLALADASTASVSIFRFGSPDPSTRLTWAADGTTPGGDGTWDASSLTWSGAYGPEAWNAGAQAVFTGSTFPTSTVTVAAEGVSVARGMSFVTGGYTVAGGSITLTGSTAPANNLYVEPAVTAAVDSPIVASAGLSKSGSGTLVVGGAVSGGNVFVNNGKLQVGPTGSIQPAALAGVTVLATGTLDVTQLPGGYVLPAGTALAGAGTVEGAVTVAASSVISPGSNVGTLTVTQNVTLSGGGNYNWQVYDASGTAGSTTGWDLLSVGGGLDIAATSGSRFNINLWSLSGVGPDVNGSALNFNSAQNGSWKIASAAGGITGFSSDAFTVNTAATSGTAGFANDLAGGSFAVVQQDNDLVLQFTAAGGPTPAPVKITGVYVKGSGWNASYLARSPFSNVQGETVGWELPDGPAQLANASNVAWNNVNTITVEFDQPIAQPDAAALQLVRGTASGNQTIVPTLDPTLLGDGSVAQWTLPAGFSALERGKYVLSIAADGITNTAGTTILDGDWITGVSTFAQGSGDGEAGGTFNFFFNSLVGDVNGDGVMNVSDLSAVRNALTSPLNTPLAADSSNYRLDINGSNSLSSADISQTRAQLTSALGTQLASLPAVTAPTAGGTIAPVPEPGVIGLLSVGLAGLIALRIARRR